MFNKNKKKITGWLDEPVDYQTTWYKIQFRGWVTPSENIKYMELFVNGKNTIINSIQNELRPDLAGEFPDEPSAENAGFIGSIVLGEKEGLYEIAVNGVTHNDIRVAIGKRTIINSFSHLFKPPKIITIGFSTTCNLACEMCPAHSRRSHWSSNGEVINSDLLEKAYLILTQYSSSLNQVYLGGFGEPFLYQNFFDLIGRVYKIVPSAQIITATNGTLLSDEIIEQILESHLTYIGISLDAGTPAIYHKIRKGGDFSRVIANLGNLVEARDQSKNKKLKIMTNFVLMRSNIYDLINYVKLGISLGVDTIQVTTPIGLFDSDANEMLFSPQEKKSTVLPAEYQGIIQDAYDIAKKNKVTIVLPIFSPSPSQVNCLLGGGSWIYMNPQGDIYPCCVLAAKGSEKMSQTYPIGNCKSQPIENIWNSESFSRFRKALHEGVPPHPVCEKCSFYHL